MCNYVTETWNEKKKTQATKRNPASGIRYNCQSS